jgi:hypothetical protein
MGNTSVPGNTLPKVIGIVFVSLLLSLGMQSAAFAVLASIEQAEQVGDSFREIYPFHLQIVGLTSPLKDQSRVLIISEPPPHISPDYFLSIVDSVGGKAFVRTNRIGYDGWVKDAVLALPPLSEDKLAFLLTRLHQDLYGTSYKANAVQLPIKPPPVNNRSLDLSVSVGDLSKWLNSKEIKFTSIIGGNARPISDILSSRQSGVFISNQRGLVVWSIPRNQDLAKYRAEARQFFLDSDLIVGAIANNNQLAIVARERTEPLLRLPPLRFETALTLAAEKTDGLSQSYERNQLFAGKLSDNTDWAPIFLSDGLVNTELGSLLNITDQLLKSWSLNGAVEYINFEYPKPSKWAAFPRPMQALFKEVKIDSILFNWNTEGVGYVARIGENEFFAINRSGALPITYGFKDKSAQHYEMFAYDYFSKLGNPDLARVVQYTALYQIFRHFNISTEESTIQGTLLPGNTAIALEASLLLEKLQAIPPEKLTELLQGISKNLQSAVEQGELDPKTANSVKNDFLAFNHKMEKLIKALKQGKERWSDDAILQLAVVTASPRTYIPRIENPQLKDWIVSTYELLVEPDISWFLSRLSDKEELKERYVEAFNGDPNTWIKTPSIVLSQYKGSETVVGGHNLDSRLTRLQPNPAVPVGKIRVAGDRVNPVILYNPSDIGRIHPLSRKLATELLPDKLLTETEFKNLVGSLENAFAEEPTLNRSLTQALDIPSTYPTQIRGLSPTLEPPTVSPSVGWSLRDKPLSPDEIQRLLIGDQPGSHSIIIERSPNAYAVLFSGNNQVVQVHTITSFYDEVLPQFMRSIPDSDPPIKIYLNGFTPDEAQALALTGSLRQKAQQISSRRDSDFPENMALLKRSYNWDRAIIKEVKTEPFSVASKSGERVIIDIEIPSISPNVPSLKMRIITFLKELPKEIADKIAAIVQRVLNRPTTQKRTVNQIAFDIHKELRKEFPDIDLSVQIEAGDIYITQPLRSDHLARR